MRVALLYDMDACRDPTGVTRHALAQLQRLAQRPGIELTAVSGRIHEPDGLAFWESLEGVSRRELPVRTRTALRYWRLRDWPPLSVWTGPVDWVYCPAEFYAPPGKTGRLAVTSHDVWQDVRFSPPQRRRRIGHVFERADLVLSVSRYNTERLLQYFPACADKVASVPNAADDLFFEPAGERERAAVRADLGLKPEVPYLLSVANFQPRKNLVRLIRAACRLPEVAEGHLALVLVGSGNEEELQTLIDTVTRVGAQAVIRLPGYRQGPALRAAYAEATALVFPSLCESFGIPAVEAMAQGCPVALADSTALPEIAGDAGWYFSPEDEAAITASLRALLDQPQERARRVALGRDRAARFRWDAANDQLVQALTRH
jgi:alpha-1,3-rhamnosyl/mannosyltransferase